MSKKADKLLLAHLTPFGFTQEEALLFIHLITHGEQTVLAVSRALEKPRTRVYRILDKLVSEGFVVEVIKEHGRSFKAANPERFDQYISEKKAALTTLENNVREVKDMISFLANTSPTASKIINYRGKDGIEQINWNSTKATETLRIFEQAQQMEQWMPHKKAERLREEFHTNRITVHQLVNVTKIPDYTRITGHVQDTTSRYLDPAILTLHNDIILYDNVVATYSKNNDELFGVEIYDNIVATTLKQMFDHFWHLAKPMKKTSPFGAAEAM